LPQDAALFARCARERRESDFRALYRRATPDLYRFALFQLGGRVERAPEAVQETWYRALIAIERYRGSSSWRT
jgi:DNA-directed RNA polymerase specialized sigma24 family protein